MEPIIGIYKITNKVNGKSYIGQSVNIHKRWTSEKNNAFNPNAHEYNYPISRAFRKYGVENFSFEIIEQCSIGDDLDAKERHWIDIYDTYFHGYNQTFGGDGGQGRYAKPKESILGIINDLKNTSLTHGEIANKWNISREMVQGINTGRYWRHNTQYPLQSRKGYAAKKVPKYEPIKQTKSNKKPSCGILLLRLQETKGNYSEVARLYGVSPNAVKKWIKSYNIDLNSLKNDTNTQKLVVDTYLQNGSLQQTAQVHNISRHKVKSILDSHNISWDSATLPKAIKMMSEGKEIQRFKSISQACLYLQEAGIPTPESTHISDVCKKRRNSAYGYQWQYITDEE